MITDFIQDYYAEEFAKASKDIFERYSKEPITIFSLVLCYEDL